MLPPAFVEHPPACRAGDQAELDEERFDYVFDRVARLGEPRGERFDPHRAARIDLRDHGEIAPVHRIEPERIDFEPGQRRIRDRGGDRPGLPDIGEVAHPPQQSPGDPRRAAEAIVSLEKLASPPLRLLLGKPVLDMMRGKLREMEQTLEEWESVTLGADYPPA